MPSKKKIHLPGEEFVKLLLAGERDFSGIELERRFLLNDGAKRHDAFNTLQNYLKQCDDAGEFEKAPIDLTGSDVRGLVAHGIYLPNLRAPKANFGSSELLKAYLYNGLFDDSDFVYAHLEGAILDHAKMRRTNLYMLGLNNALVKGTDFEGVRGAVTVDAEGVDFSVARNADSFTLEATNMGTYVNVPAEKKQNVEVFRMTVDPNAKKDTVAIEPAVKKPTHDPLLPDVFGSEPVIVDESLEEALKDFPRIVPAEKPWDGVDRRNRDRRRGDSDRRAEPTYVGSAPKRSFGKLVLPLLASGVALGIYIASHGYDELMKREALKHAEEISRVAEDFPQKLKPLSELEGILDILPAKSEDPNVLRKKALEACVLYENVFRSQEVQDEIKSIADVYRDDPDFKKKVPGKVEIKYDVKDGKVVNIYVETGMDPVLAESFKEAAAAVDVPEGSKGTGFVICRYRTK